MDSLKLLLKKLFARKVETKSNTLKYATGVPEPKENPIEKLGIQYKQYRKQIKKDGLTPMSFGRWIRSKEIEGAVGFGNFRRMKSIYIQGQRVRITGNVSPSRKKIAYA